MLKIIHELRRTTSRNKKENILKNYRHDDIWKRYLTAMYDSSINYYIRSVPDGTFISEDDADLLDMEEMFAGLEALSRREVTGNAAKNFAVELSSTYGQLFRMVLDGSLKAGVTIKTLNKVYDNFIPEFLVMLGRDVGIVKFPVLMSTKFDGVRLVAVVSNRCVELFTRSGKRLQLKSLELAMSNYPDGVYDGELVDGIGKVVNRTRITGEVNKILKGSSTFIENYRFVMFDYISPIEWLTRKCITPYSRRLELLDSYVTNTALVMVAEQTLASDNESIQRVFNELVEDGYEGVIVRYLDGLYEWKRSDGLIKRKSIKSCILRCVDTVEGNGKYKGLIGALVCEGVVEGKLVQVKLGSGLSDTDRDEEPETYIGRDIDAAYNTVVSDGKTYSLFLPRFKRVAGKFST